MKNFYITTTLPYVNAPIHLGHATEIIRADVIARYKKLQGFYVFFNTGTDEHGQKIFESAEKAGKSVQEYVDFYADLYKKTLNKFGVLKDTHYIRTTDENHIKSAQEFWKICDRNGYIYKKNYQAKYCVGCEEEKKESELVDGKCPEHNRIPDLVNEENYFFKFSAFEKKLLDMFEKNPNFIIPDYRMNEMREFIKRGLQDFSISRLKTKMSWGIPVPGDENHVMYVWFDALTNYISTLGWPHIDGDFERFWVNGTPTQYCGKNNTRFQGLMWQAMLLACDLKPTHQIVVDGFILGDGGVKMSKSLGNTIDPLEVVEEYGTDALRYFVLRDFHPFEDTAVSKEKLKESYNAGLANGLGNLTSRIMKMAITNINDPIEIIEIIPDGAFAKQINVFNLQKATDIIWSWIGELDAIIQEKEPFKLVKVDPEEAKKIITDLVRRLANVAFHLRSILPETSEKILNLIHNHQIPEAPLFMRKD